MSGFYNENGAGVTSINSLTGDVVLAAGTNITLVEVGNTITINSSGTGGGILLQTDGVNNGSQSLLNLIAGIGMTLTDDGLGGITFDATGSVSLIGQTSGIISSPTPVGPGTETYLGEGAGAGASTDAIVAIGINAGQDATNASSSVFIGPNAGLSASNSSSSVFIGPDAGSGSTTAFSSVFIGSQSGVGADNLSSAVFIGVGSGGNASRAASSIFLGQGAGNNASDAAQSFFGGAGAGDGATNAAVSVFIGSQAGVSATDATNAVFLGQGAGAFASNAPESTFIGTLAGDTATNAFQSNFFGSSAGENATNADTSNFIGLNAGSGATNASHSVFIGENAGAGDTVDYTSTPNKSSILIGRNTNTNGFTNGVAFGDSAVNTKDNQFSLSDVITDVRWAGQEYTLPTSSPDGVLTNTGGVLSWVPGGSGSQDLQSVTDVGNTTTNQIIAGAFHATQTAGAALDIDDPSNPGEVGTISYSDRDMAFFGANAAASYDINFSTVKNTFIGLSGIQTGFQVTSTANRTLSYPDADGTFALSVNGNTPDAEGNITIATGSGTVTSVTSATADATVATTTTTPIITIVSAPKWTTGRTLAITGDLAYTSPSFDGSGNVTAAGTLATVNSNVGSFTNASITVNGKGLVTAASSGAAPEVPLTFSTGLTRTSNTVTDNLATGISGGQSAIGGTASGNNLTLSSTSNATKGKIIFGSASAYDEVNTRLGINQATPTARLHILNDSIGITQTDATGAYLQNSTAATSGLQQYSPGIVMAGSSWTTNAGGSAQDSRIRIDNAPLQKSIATTMPLFRVQQSNNGGAYGDLFSVGGQAGSGNGLYFNFAGLPILSNAGGVTMLIGQGSLGLSFNSSGLISRASMDNTGVWALIPSSNTATSGTVNAWSDTGTFAPTSGTAVWNMMTLAPTINQTGGANGITRGLYINPTVTAASDFRAIEVSAGNSLLRNLKLTTAGDGLYVKEGTNATMGQVTLVGGTAVVSTTKVTANSRIFLQADGGTLTNIGFQYVSARTAGTSFTISSINVLDTSNVDWIIIEPA